MDVINNFAFSTARLRLVRDFAAVSSIAVVSMLLGCQQDPQSGEDSSMLENLAAASLSLEIVNPPSGEGALAPNLHSSADSASTLLSWLEATDAGHSLFVSSLDGDTWAPAIEISSGSDFFANWADLPAVIDNGSGGQFAHWLAKLGDGTYAYGVRLAHSADRGETWQELGLLHDDDSATEHGFVSYATRHDGDLQAFWLDGRAMLHGGSMQLRTATVSHEGAAPSQSLDDRVCECCATDAATTSSGPIVVYRDRSDDEIRDIAVVRTTSEGWSQPTLIHDDGWKIFGCPVNGPAIAARDELVAVAWFTAAHDAAKVLLSLSHDAGATFGAPIIIDDAAPVGRVDVEIDALNGTVVSWLGSTQDASDRGEIRLRRVASAGTVHPAQTVATTSQARSAGFPKMVRHGDGLLFVWVDDVEPPRLRAAALTAQSP